jgi:hypothetical protein
MGCFAEVGWAWNAESPGGAHHGGAHHGGAHHGGAHHGGAQHSSDTAVDTEVLRFIWGLHTNLSTTASAILPSPL